MSDPKFSIEILKKHDRSDFDCSVETLNQYLKTQASQDIKKGACVCYVALERNSNRVAGFYTLSAADIPVTDIEPHQIRQFPRYPSVPAVRIGRLAIDKSFHGLKLGSALLADAVTRTASSGIGVFAMIVDAKDENAAEFYRHHGFTFYGSAPNKLIAPMKQLLAG